MFTKRELSLISTALLELEREYEPGTTLHMEVKALKDKAWELHQQTKRKAA